MAILFVAVLAGTNANVCSRTFGYWLAPPGLPAVPLVPTGGVWPLFELVMAGAGGFADASGAVEEFSEDFCAQPANANTTNAVMATIVILFFMVFIG
jgi:hypothetical protein